MLSTQWVVDLLSSWGNGAIIISLVISIAIAIIGILPSIFVTGANVIIFGIYYGLVISWLGEVLGAGIAFYLYRKGFKQKTEQFGNKYVLLKKITQAQGTKVIVLIFEARLLPYVPSGLVTLAGALSNISLLPFMLATALGKLPSIILEVLISYQLFSLRKDVIGIFLTFIFIVTIFLMKRERDSL